MTPTAPANPVPGPPARTRLAAAVAVVLVVVVAVVAAGWVTSGPHRPVGSSALGDPALVAARVTNETLGSTLDALAAIASANGGTRRTGGAGDAATVEYLAGALRELGYHVDEDAFETPVFSDGATDLLEVDGTSSAFLRAGRDFGPMMFSPAASVEGLAVDLGWDPNATAPDGRGCNASDFDGVPVGSVVLVRPANCLRRAVAISAANAGAVAIVTAYPWAAAGEVRRATLVDPGGISIPAIAADRAAGDALAAAAQSGDRVRIVTSGTTESRTVRSIVADLAGVDRSRIVMVGAHLDSSLDGPGIDDDGSGIAAVLGLARALAGTTPTITVRFAFWAAEESGLHGSSHYVQDHASSGSERIVAYVNVDMIGSPNGFAAVYDDAHAAPGSARIRDLFEADLSAANVRWKTLDLFGSADHAPFEQAGIPTGGLFSGANEVVSTADAARFGRTAGQFADPCYHLACDSRENVDRALMLALARSVVRVTVSLAAG